MDLKYIGMDVHKEAIAIAVMNGERKLVMESIIETKASIILQFIQGLRGDLHVTLETWVSMLWYSIAPAAIGSLLAFIAFYAAHARGLHFAGIRQRDYPI